MDAVFGICGKAWVVIVTDTAVNRSIFSLKHNEDKITDLSDHKIVGTAGEVADRTQFTKYIERNLAL